MCVCVGGGVAIYVAQPIFIRALLVENKVSKVWRKDLIFWEIEE